LPPPPCLQDARRRLPDVAVCGYISHVDRRTVLNPPDGQQLSRGDKLIVLAHRAAPQLAGEGCAAAGLDLQALQAQLEAAVAPAPTPKSIVVVGWSGPLGDLMVGGRAGLGRSDAWTAEPCPDSGDQPGGLPRTLPTPRPCSAAARRRRRGCATLLRPGRR
jgi:hypothetical protein